MRTLDAPRPRNRRNTNSAAKKRSLATRRARFLAAVESLEQRTLLSGDAPGLLFPGEMFPTGFGPSSVAVGDFDGDGRPDLAVGDANLALKNYDGGVSVLLGNGDGTFQPRKVNATGLYPSSIAAGDFDGDGRPDLATANNSSGDVSVMLGNGDGTFQPQKTYAAGAGPQSVAVGDFDGDGRPDLATANRSGNSVSVLLGNGDGTFQAQKTYAAGYGPRSVAVGDFDGDGRQDLATANFSSGDVSVLLGNGDGTFLAQATYAVGYGPQSVAVGDIDGDGRPDLATVSFSGDVLVLLGNGDGTFQSRMTDDVGSSSRSVVVGDIDGDGRPDLTVLSGNSVSVMLGNGDGSFQTQRTYAAGAGPQSVAVGDFDGDGWSDLVTANYTSDDVSVLLGNGDGSFQSRMVHGAGSWPESVVVGDFDGDGRPDLATANHGDGLSVLLGDGDGTFQPRKIYAAGNELGSITVGDFDGDGRPDLAVANDIYRSGVLILLGNGDGTFHVGKTYATGYSPASVAVGDFDGDGRPDLAVTSSVENAMSVLLGNGDGTFQAKKTYFTGFTSRSVVAGDFDGDGRPDLVMSGPGNRVSVMLGNGDGTFQAKKTYFTGSTSSSVMVGDFDGDGRLDLATANSGGDSVSVLLGNGDGTFQSQATYAAGDSPRSVVVGDIDGDGRPDLVTANSGGNSVSVLLGNGDGTFQAQKRYAAGGSPVSVVVGDFDGDGRLDLATVNNTSDGIISVLLNARGQSGPDLTIVSPALPNLPPAGARFGGSVDVSWTVRNSGGSAVDAGWVDQIWFSRDGIAGNADDHLLLSLAGGSLPAGADSTREAAVTLPLDASFAPGDYRIIVVTDATGVLAERDEGNNRGDVALTVSPPPLPNLVVSAVTAPAKIVTNRSTTVEWTVTNIGDGDPGATPWQDAVYLSLDDKLDGSDVLLGRAENPSYPNAGDGYVNSLAVTLPPNLVGVYYFLVRVDDQRQVHEYQSEGDNVSAVGPTLVDLIQPYMSLALPTDQDTGASSYDDLTAIAAPTMQVAVNKAGTVGLDYTGDAVADLTQSAYGPQTLSFELPTLADGSHTIRAFFTPVHGELVQARRTITIDKTGPSVSSIEPTGTVMGSFNHIDVTFTEPIQESSLFPSLTSSVVTLIGPGGPIVVGIPYLVSENTCRIPFASQDLPGTYTLTVGTGVKDVAGNPLNQDGDAVNGEAEDAYTTTIQIVAPTIEISASSASVGETGETSTATGTVSRGVAAAYPFVVTLTTSDPTALTVPATVTIPAGASSADFPITAVHDGFVTGDKFETITASGIGFTSSTAQLTVVDVDVPTLGVSLDTTQVIEGKTVALTIRRNANLGQALVVSLGESNPSSAVAQFVLPKSVVIPAGQTSVTLTVPTVDDTLIERNKVVTISADASGYPSATGVVTVVDDDLPTLSLSVLPSAFSEGAGAGAAIGTVTRDVVTDQTLTVKISSSNAGKAAVPLTVVIPAGQAWAVFSIAAVDNALSDGNQTATILVNGAYPECGCTILQGSASADVLVTDDESPGIGINPGRDSAIKGSTFTATVTREGDVSAPLVVALSSSDPAKLAVPDSVTIPAGSESASFDVATIDDGIPGTRVPYAITATADGYNLGMASLVVIDAHMPDLVVASVTAPASVATDGDFNVTYRIQNNGTADATGTWTQFVYLSMDRKLDAEDAVVGSFDFTGTIPPTLYFERTITVHAPTQTGTRYILVAEDVNNSIAEADETNNTTASGPITVSAEYSATVATTVATALAGTSIPMTGRATETLDGSPAKFKLINIHVMVRGTDRVISALTDANGDFAVTFKPIPGEGGDYTIGATHPGVATAAAQDSFSLLRILAEPPSSAVQLIEGADAVSGLITLKNLSQSTLTGLTVQVLNKPANVDVAFRLGDGSANPALGGDQTIPLTYTLSATDAGTAGGTMTLRVTTAEGATVDVPITADVIALRPLLSTDPGQIEAGMIRGGQTLVEVTVNNTGGKESGPLIVALPAVSWMSAASGTDMASIPAGGSAKIVLQLTPTADMALGDYTGQIPINGLSAELLSIPFTLRALSTAEGDLSIVAEDEYTYFADGAPHVAGASVTVTDAIDGAVVATGVTGADGTFAAADLREGYYTISIIADQHTPYRAQIAIAAGQTSALTAFMPRKSVTYNFTVVPTQIEDKTSIHVNADFETAVPMPVVVVSPRYIDVSALTFTNGIAQVNISITNYGLIAADNLSFTPPTHPDYDFTALTTDIGTLPAQSEVVIPVLIRDRSYVAPFGSIQGVAQADPPAFLASATIVATDLTTGLEYTGLIAADGSFSLPLLPVGQYVLSVPDFPGSTFSRSIFNITSGSDFSGIQVQIRNVTAIAGTLNADPKTIAQGLLLLLYQDNQLIGSTNTDAKGKFSFTDLDPGTYSLVALGADPTPLAGQTVTVVSGVNHLTLSLGPRVTVTARIQDEMGAPVELATLFLSPVDSPQILGIRAEAESGMISATGIVPGRYTVTVIGVELEPVTLGTFDLTGESVIDLGPITLISSPSSIEFVGPRDSTQHTALMEAEPLVGASTTARRVLGNSLESIVALQDYSDLQTALKSGDLRYIGVAADLVIRNIIRDAFDTDVYRYPLPWLVNEIQFKEDLSKFLIARCESLVELDPEIRSALEKQVYLGFSDSTLTGRLYEAEYWLREFWLPKELAFGIKTWSSTYEIVTDYLNLAKGDHPLERSFTADDSIGKAFETDDETLEFMRGYLYWIAGYSPQLQEWIQKNACDIEKTGSLEHVFDVTELLPPQPNPKAYIITKKSSELWTYGFYDRFSFNQFLPMSQWGGEGYTYTVPTHIAGGVGTTTVNEDERNDSRALAGKVLVKLDKSGELQLKFTENTYTVVDGFDFDKDTNPGLDWQRPYTERLQLLQLNGWAVAQPYKVTVNPALQSIEVQTNAPRCDPDCNANGTATYSVHCSYDRYYSQDVTFARLLVGENCDRLSPSSSGNNGTSANPYINTPSFSPEVPCTSPIFAARALSTARDGLKSLANASPDVCATVQISIDQSDVQTRDAFSATLDFGNGTTNTFTNIQIGLVVLDSNGNDVTALFGVLNPSLSEINAVDGTGILEAGTTGQARWTLVPSLGAAGSGPITYSVGGTLRYVDDGVELVVPLAAVAITVHPQPELKLDYFLQRDVYSDDPFTDEVEPSQPFELAVMVQNIGAGDAHNLAIESARPKIVDNEKGLLSNFQIIASEINGQSKPPSLTADFGDVAAGDAELARWYMTSSLQGLFIDYSATFEHQGLGGKQLSLITGVDIHELIHSGQAISPADAGKTALLVNDVPDADDAPDTVYLAAGRKADVVLATDAAFDAAPDPDHLQIHLTSTVQDGWSYLNVDDPGAGMYRLVRVVRSDGVVIPATNFWQTDRTFIGGGHRPILENKLHLLDQDGTGSYTLIYEPVDQTPIDAATVTTLQASVPSSTYGDSLTFTAVVSSDAGSPAGTVQFIVDGVNFGSPVALVNGVAVSGSAASLGAGSHTVTASYSGGAGFTTSDGGLSVSIAKARLTVAADNQDMVRYDAVPGLSYTIGGFVNGEDAAAVTGSPTISTSATSTSPAGHYAVDVAAGSLTASNYDFDLVPGTLTVHPKVVDVRVSWGSQSMSILGLNRTLPFININAVDVIFSDDVAVDAADLTLVGTLTKNKIDPPSGFTYDPASHAARWTLADALVKDRFSITLDGVQASGGIDLGGYAAGFSVLPGDFNGDNTVNSQDLVAVRNGILGVLDQGLDVWADVNGDGKIDVNDYTAVKKFVGKRF